MDTITVKIARATHEDLQVLAKINRLAYYRETISQLAFTDWPDEQNMFDFFKARLTDRLQRSNTQIFMATDVVLGTVLGFVCLTLETGSKTGPNVEAEMLEILKQSEMTPTAKVLQQMPSYMNGDFILATGAKVDEMISHMKGEEHYYISTFAVNPRYQKRGIGSQLLRHCLQIADDASLRTWLIAFPGSHSLYVRLGFSDVESRDIDLDAWAKGKYCGYGIYRQYSMVREAQ